MSIFQKYKRFNKIFLTDELKNNINIISSSLDDETLKSLINGLLEGYIYEALFEKANEELKSIIKTLEGFVGREYIIDSWYYPR